MTKKAFLIISTSLSILMIVLVVMNEYSMHQVTELCEEVGGTAYVDKNFFSGSWSVSCDGIDDGINQ
ncbi:hypothetical protein [Salipaludibacillus daqingensis]|uniref:hypothetical protein n=1 Tax=Salipaludibacillus daqingensis TaxID=3041001 RepID=UPI0024752B98|nr:hypothetical protein [Salipaludibacillus daqingensis]